MTSLQTLLEAVKDEHLPLEMIERYRDQMIHLFTQVCLELSSLKKKEALFFVQDRSEKISDVAIKRLWRATSDGQRLLELEAYKTALPKEIDSLRSRIYAHL